MRFGHLPPPLWFEAPASWPTHLTIMCEGPGLAKELKPRRARMARAFSETKNPGQKPGLCNDKIGPAEYQN